MKRRPRARPNRAPQRPQAAGLQAGPGTVVVIRYRLYDASESLVGESEQPAEFLLGYGELPPGLEQALSGMRAGERRSARLTPERGFGQRDPDAIIFVDKSEFPDDVVVGDRFEAEAGNGDSVLLTVLEVDDEALLVDTNAPLAGQTVRVEVALDKVMMASEERLAAVARRLERLTADPEQLIDASRLLGRCRQRYENGAERQRATSQSPLEPAPMNSTDPEARVDLRDRVSVAPTPVGGTETRNRHQRRSASERSLNDDTMGHPEIRRESEEEDARQPASDRSAARPPPSGTAGSGSTM